MRCQVHTKWLTAFNTIADKIDKQKTTGNRNTNTDVVMHVVKREFELETENSTFISHD